jgi:hypothetical protein
MANSLKTTVGYSGSAQVTIEATEATNGINFKVYLSGEGTDLVGDIRGLFLDLAKDTGDTLKSDTTDPFNWYNGSIITGDEKKYHRDSVGRKSRNRPRKWRKHERE